MKSYTYHFMDKDYRLGFFYDRYTYNGNLYVGLFNLDDDEDPWFADLTINIMILLPYAAIIDNQFDSDITVWLEGIGAGKTYNDKVHCSFAEYPIFQFDPAFLRDANPESFAKLNFSIASSCTSATIPLVNSESNSMLFPM